MTLQEKVKGKNKLVPRLLGITKKSIVRVDENTKEVSSNFKETFDSQKMLVLASRPGFQNHWQLYVKGEMQRCNHQIDEK